MRFFLSMLSVLAWSPVLAGTDFAYVDRLNAAGVVIDTRPVAECRQATLPNARCLPAAEFLSPRGRLPSERDLLWLLGTAGLDGSEVVLVVGDSTTARDFVAGLLYLCGQRQVQVLTGPLTPWLANRADVRPGQERGIVRATVFTAPMRDDLWLVNARERAAAPVGSVIHAPDAYTAIVRFTRQAAGGGKMLRVAWDSSPRSLLQ